MVRLRLIAELIPWRRPVQRAPTVRQARGGLRPSLDGVRRFRDLTCRFHNCDVPAGRAISTTPSLAVRPDPPSNLSMHVPKKTICSKHFWDGWSDVSDSGRHGRWTSPTGKTYATHPGSRGDLPALEHRRAAAADARTVDPTRARTLMMPTDDGRAPRTESPTSSGNVRSTTRLMSPNATNRRRSDPFG